MKNSKGVYLKILNNYIEKVRFYKYKNIAEVMVRKLATRRFTSSNRDVKRFGRIGTLPVLRNSGNWKSNDASDSKLHKCQMFVTLLQNAFDIL